MWKELEPLEIVNIISGFIVLILFGFTFRISRFSFLIVALAITFIFGSYIWERINIQIVGERYDLKPSVLQRAEQAFEIILLIFNVLAMILLFWPEWWSITHSFEGYVIFSLKLGFYLLIFNRDFVKIGRTLARSAARNKAENQT